MADGVGFNILQDTQPLLPHLEGIWIPTARQYLRDISGSIQIAGMTVQELDRHGDQYIMDVVLASNRFALAEVKFVNYCRLFLQVLTISDLCNASGTELAEGILAGYRHVSQSWSSLHEPFQERPNNQVWGLWRRFLKLICYDKDQLNRPLGPWFLNDASGLIIIFRRVNASMFLLTANSRLTERYGPGFLATTPRKISTKP